MQIYSPQSRSFQKRLSTWQRWKYYRDYDFRPQIKLNDLLSLYLGIGSAHSHFELTLQTEFFQDDIFIPTVIITSALLTPQQWYQGKAVELPHLDLKPSHMTPGTPYLPSPLNIFREVC